MVVGVRLLELWGGTIITIVRTQFERSLSESYPRGYLRDYPRDLQGLFAELCLHVTQWQADYGSIALVFETRELAGW